jgi:hypothetical protein
MNMRISPEAKKLLAALAERMGVNKTAYFEMLVREKAKAEGIKTSGNSPENEASPG